MSEEPRTESVPTPPTPPPPSTPPARRLGCWAIGLITCGSLFLIFAVFLGVLAWVGRPYLRQAVRTGVEMGQCKEQLLSLHGALQRYQTRRDEYPKSLDQLHPTFITRRGVFHCPADDDPDGVSYEYSPPASSAAPPDESPLVTCRHHQIDVAGRKATYLLRLQRDGKVIQETEIAAEVTAGTKAR
jgi:hypothetical protein